LYGTGSRHSLLRTELATWAVVWRMVQYPQSGSQPAPGLGGPVHQDAPGAAAGRRTGRSDRV